MTIKNKLLIVYNTCGLSGRENINYYNYALNTILRQNIDHSRIVISDCCSSPQIRQQLQNIYNNHISYNFIDDIVPVNVSFNHSILQGIKEFGEFDGYLYVDSGVCFTAPNQITKLYELLLKGYGLVSARVDDDSGAFVNFGLGQDEGDQSQEYKLFEQGDFIVPLGRATNLHCQIFSHDIQQYYNRCFPDIFASWCSESIFTFLCAAIKKKWIISKEVKVHHSQGVDGQSSGFNPQNWKIQGRPNIDHPFIVPSIVDIMKKGQPYGMGYEEAQNVVMHDPQKFDDNGYAVDYRLKDFIRDNVFLQPYQFSYDTINHSWRS